MASPTNQRGLRDNNLASNAAALPNAANTVNTNVVDLGRTTPYAITEHVAVLIATTQGTGANSKNINIALHESADNSNWANMANLGVPPHCQLVDNASVTSNYAATNFRLTLPPSVKRYIRAGATGEANGGNASGGTFTLSVCF